jgi:WD40 repeat protein
MKQIVRRAAFAKTPSCFRFLLLISLILSGCAPDGPTLESGLRLLQRRPQEIHDPYLKVSTSAAKLLPAQFPAAISPLLLASHTEASPAEAEPNSGPYISTGPNSQQSGNRTIVPLRDFDLFHIQQGTGHQGEINALVISKDGTRAYTGGNDGSVISSSIIKPDSENKQDMRNPSAAAHWQMRVQTLLEGSKPISALALSPNERYLGIAQFSAIFVFDLQEMKLLFRMSRITGQFPSLRWDPRGELLLFGRTSGESYVWHVFSGKAAGEDSLDAIEQYGDAGGGSIIDLLFHPSGRAFIAAEQTGGLTFWRLLRTESELGLRDDSAEEDQGRQGNERVSIGKVPAIIEDLWLGQNAEELYVSAVDGNIYRWKMRGLELGPKFEVGADSVGSIQGINLKPKSHTSRGSNNIGRFLITTGRGQQIKFWCRPRTFNDDDKDAETRRVPIINSKSSADSDPNRNQTQIIGGRIVLPEESPPAVPPVGTKVVPAAQTEGFLVAQTEAFKDPSSLLRANEHTAVLWAVQKKGNLLIFDAGPLLSSLAAKCPLK